MTLIDHLLVGSYFLLMTLITFYSSRQDRKNMKRDGERGYAEKHFLAGRRVSTVEAVFSIVATEFSAITFVQLPALVILGTKGLLWGLIGILIGRWLVARFLLLNFYRSGLTIFESLARGSRGYVGIRKSPQRARRLMAMIYFFSKVLSVSGAIAIGVNFISLFTEIPFPALLLGIVALTTTYTIVGGLRAVMRTDILQFWLITLSGVVILVSTSSGLTLGFFTDRLLPSFVSPERGVVSSIVLGIALGLINDFLTHGIEQDFVQKLKACRTPTLAFNAVYWSTGVSLGLQLLFIFIGVSLLGRIDPSGLDLAQLMERVIVEMQSSLGPAARGVVIIGLLAATMSSLDSSINALSSVLWNDILPSEKIARYPSLVIVDNVVVCFFVILFAFFVAKTPQTLSYFMNFNVLIVIPLACCFILRFVLFHHVNFDFTLFSLILVLLGSVVGVLVNSLYLNFALPLALFSSILSCSLLLLLYERLKRWL